MGKVFIKGYTVEVFKGYAAQELFITKNGEKVYSCRLAKNDSAMKRARQVIAQQ